MHNSPWIGRGWVPIRWTFPLSERRASIWQSAAVASADLNCNFCFELCAEKTKMMENVFKLLHYGTLWSGLTNMDILVLVVLILIRLLEWGVSGCGDGGGRGRLRWWTFAELFEAPLVHASIATCVLGPRLQAIVAVYYMGVVTLDAHKPSFTTINTTLPQTTHRHIATIEGVYNERFILYMDHATGIRTTTQNRSTSNARSRKHN